MTSAIGLAIGFVVLVPLISFAIVAGLMVTFLQFGIVLALFGYFLGHPVRRRVQAREGALAPVLSLSKVAVIRAST